MKKILRSSRRMRAGGSLSCLATLFLLCGSFFLLPLTADDYVECTDPFPDELLDIFGLIERPVNNLVIAFPYAMCVFLESENHPNSGSLLPISHAITSRIILSTVIRV